MALSEKNKLNFKAVYIVSITAIIALVCFEFFPIIFKYLFGDVLQSSIKITSAVISFLVLAYGVDKSKKHLDAANELKH
jgi:hypothetical protein